MYLHPTYAVSPAREPLGVLDAWMWAREPKGPDGTHPGIGESVRWNEGYARVIELLLLVLKEGCRIEALQLSTMERIERALALFLVVGWRIARLMRLGRTLPDLDAALLLEPEEWQAAYILAKKPLPRRLRVSTRCRA